MSAKRYINNLSGILYYMEFPLIKFNIKKKKLIEYEVLGDGRLIPEVFKVRGILYEAFVSFFERRMLTEESQFYKEHLYVSRLIEADEITKENKKGFDDKLILSGLKQINSDSFEMDEYIKLLNGNNNVDCFWIRFPDSGIESFEDLINR